MRWTSRNYGNLSVCNRSAASFWFAGGRAICFAGVSLTLLLMVHTPSDAQCMSPTTKIAPHVLSYAFEPIINSSSMAMRVTVAFHGGAAGLAVFELPSEWFGQQHLEKSITDLKAVSPATSLSDGGTPATKIVHFTPNSRVEISYVLVKDWNGPLTASATRFRADLNPDYFHLIGVSALAHPRIEDSTVVEAHFDWQKLPAVWSLATSFGTGNRCQSFRGTWHDALYSLFVGGDYRVHIASVCGGTVTALVRGKWSFSDDEWMNDVRKIMEAQRTFWHGTGFPYFLVALTPLTQDHGNMGGAALTNAFSMHLPRLDSIGLKALTTLAHETFHAWNPLRLGHRPGKSWYPVSWFTEGFTVYYTDRMLFRAGMLTFLDYIGAINDKLRNYATGEGKGVSLQEFVRRKSANESDLNELDYRRGAVIALWLDATIRAETDTRSSLRNIMFDLYLQNRAYERGHRTASMELTNERIFLAAAKYLTPASLQAFRHYVEAGGGIPVPQDALGPCVQAAVETVTSFDLGFDRQSTEDGDNVVRGVEPASEAYKAGVRDGQKLTGTSIYFGDTSKPVRLWVATPSGQQVITYYPRGASIPVEQFTVRQGSSDSKSCLPAFM